MEKLDFFIFGLILLLHLIITPTDKPAARLLLLRNYISCGQTCCAIISPAEFVGVDFF